MKEGKPCKMSHLRHWLVSNTYDLEKKISTNFYQMIKLNWIELFTIHVLLKNT